MIWFGWVLWHINHCRLFNAKSSLYIYIKYIWFGLVGFYGISTIVGYLMPNPFYTYILNIYDLWTHFVDNILKWAWAHFLYPTKWFQASIVIQHQLFYSTLFIYFHTVKCFQGLLLLLNESWRVEEICCPSNSSEKPSVKTDVKNSKGVNNNDNKG